MPPSPTPTPSPSQQPPSARTSLPALIALRDQMQQLHAELEYLRLMLAIQKRGR
jgi:hypothetical protein